jgi:pimeloyl-ACP methyl ester carboxylesterase
MPKNNRIIVGILGVAGMAVLALGLTALGAGLGWIQAPVPTPAMALDDTSMEPFSIEDFDAVHSPIGSDGNEHLIFGGLPVESSPADLSPRWAAFLGRWEGYSYAPPVQKDYKFVLLIQEISAEGGTAYLWFGTNLQYPEGIKKIQFRTVPGDPPYLEWRNPDWGEGSVCTVTYNSDSGELEGWIKQPEKSSDWGPIRLGRGTDFHVYQDYPAYLESKRIYAKEYADASLTRNYGAGFLLYLPEGYENDPDQSWPLIFFLHGAGDRGANVYLLAKASPLMMIREKGPLPFIIVAPLLKLSGNFYSFPEAYMDGVLDQILADYRADRKRIYVTGLSIGGEATYRFAIHRPETFAAIAPLSGFMVSLTGLESIKDVPVWAIHGADDTVVPLDREQRVVDALIRAGGNVRFTVLEGHDHDVWTDTYLDPLFYQWFLDHRRP